MIMICGTANIVTGPRRTARRPVCRPCYPNAGPTIVKPPAAPLRRADAPYPGSFLRAPRQAPIN
ncbi:hypothetical protein DM992_16100 [Burkholderia sp. JP2-270]|nr:hypothetical protein DM992_16100 [Burkholderia sp. JP2-270]